MASWGAETSEERLEREAYARGIAEGRRLGLEEAAALLERNARECNDVWAVAKREDGLLEAAKKYEAAATLQRLSAGEIRALVTK